MSRVGVDVGGTFTDLVHIGAGGTLAIRKVASTPSDPSTGLFRALDALDRGGPIAVLIHGTTLATNALLERRGARVALVTTAGFEDLLWLRRQDRAALYDLSRDHPAPLVARECVVGVAERMGPEGPVVALTDGELGRVVAAVRALVPRPEAIAIALLFAFRHPAHERRLAAALRHALPDVSVAASHDVLPVFREYERASTTTAEAYLRPVVAGYLARTAAGVAARGVRALRIITSSGGTLDPERAATRAAALAVSGPAGGVVGARRVGAALGIADLLTIDMGGTSADASLVTRGVALTEGAQSVGGVPLALPAVLIDTVSAGGGSIATIDEGGALRVGPRSAGADPGPACYGRGGTEPTVTDACLVLGWLDAAHPLADDLRLDTAAAERALAPLARMLGKGSGVTRAAAGIVSVAAAAMARALKRVSVARGIDPRGMTLLPFGGAGPLFGCALADALGMSRLVVPPHPGVLSALGLAAAQERVELVASCHQPLRRLDRAALARLFEPLCRAARAELGREGIGEDREDGAIGITRFADCRFVGQGYELTVRIDSDDPAALEAAFHQAHRARHGHADLAAAVELVNARVVAEWEAVEPEPPLRAAPPSSAYEAPERRRIVTRDDAVVRAAVWPLAGLAAGQRLAGPAILAGPDATALIEPGWSGVAHASGAIVVERA